MTPRKKPEEKKKRGRPSLYRPEYAEKMMLFFSIPKEISRLKAHITGKNEYQKDEYEWVANDLPTFFGFARSIGFEEHIVSKWAKKHKEFNTAYNACKQLQKEFLIGNGLKGNYPPASYIFTAKNITDMRDKTETALSGLDSFFDAYKQAKKMRGSRGQ